jgi:uncharacterized protein (DUF1015 family)
MCYLSQQATRHLLYFILKKNKIDDMSSAFYEMKKIYIRAQARGLGMVNLRA